MKNKIIDYLNNSIFGEFYKMFKKPWCTSFTVHFIIYIIIVGGFGVFASIFQYLNDKGSPWSITENIITYSIALAIPSIVPILLAKDDSKHQSSLAQLTPFICIVIPLTLTFFSYYYEIMWPSIISLVVSWIVWVISQHDNVFLNDKTYGERRQENAKKKHGRNW